MRARPPSRGRSSARWVCHRLSGGPGGGLGRRGRWELKVVRGPRMVTMQYRRYLLAAGLLLSACAAAAAAPDADIRSLVEAGHWKQARALLEPRVKSDPSDAEAVALLSQVRTMFGDYDGAIELAQ